MPFVWHHHHFKGNVIKNMALQGKCNFKPGITSDIYCIKMGQISLLLD